MSRNCPIIRIPTKSQNKIKTKYALQYQARNVSFHFICVLRVSILLLSLRFLLHFGTVQTVWYFGTVPTVWYFGTVPTVWYFRTVPTVWYFRTVPTVWYFRTVPTVWYFRTVPTVWYFCFVFFIL